MTSHPSDDELIQHGAGDLPADMRGEIDAHLRLCADCRTVSDDVRESLALLHMADVPDPGDNFEDRLWARIAPLVPERRRAWGRRQFVPLAAWAAVAIGMLAVSAASLSYRTEPRSPAAANNEAPSSAPRRVLLAALDDHFAETEMLLVELLNAPGTGRESLEFERATAGDLVASGRLYRETAEDTGQRQFAEIIDELEPVLVDVARSQDAVDTDELAGWRARIEDAGLLFKVRAATNEVRARREPPASTGKGAL
jgi:hypothetical protein